MENYIEKAINEKKDSIKSGKNVYEVGSVSSVQTYLLEVTGINNASFFDKVIVQRKEVGVIGEGYIDKINRDSVTVSLTRKECEVMIGDEAIATGEEFMMQYSPECVGHIVDMFGKDLLYDKKFNDLYDLPIETENIPIMDRGPVNRPFATGIVGIDLMYPIGKGQRQLIIGDKKTGKTQIALDAICNQAKENVVCIYVAIGKTKKEVKTIFAELSKRGAMDYSIILAAFNDECPPVLRNTPFAALSIANTLLMDGKDVLVVIDDLKRHADVCREIALLSGKVPGRDAYPSDIFYTHASLLEKGCQHKNGGSITILPICETKGGDITDYISTNIISITDGQIVLSTKNFEKNQKPAINYGLSVSRLGGAVQTGVMKKASAVVRRELLSYLETRDVYELVNENEMSKELQEKMQRGRTILSKLCQPKYSPRDEATIVKSFAELYKN